MVDNLRLGRENRLGGSWSGCGVLEGMPICSMDKRDLGTP